VVLERKYGVPEIVNDGVTIARDIELADPEQNVGVKLVQEVATKSDMKAGDGTTTSTVMTQAIVNQGMRQVGLNTVVSKFYDDDDDDDGCEEPWCVAEPIGIIIR